MKRIRTCPNIDVTAVENLFITIPCEGYVEGIHSTANSI
jgi:hypothetical protein